MTIDLPQLRHWVLAVALAIASSAAGAQTSPVGLWRTIDEGTGKAKALVRIREERGVLSGRIERIFDPDPGWNGLCERCRDSRKDQPVAGMTILSGLKQHGEGYGGGEILDPESGNVYRSSLKLTADGNALEVRGYIGTPLFGRTQKWIRER